MNMNAANNSNNIENMFISIMLSIQQLSSGVAQLNSNVAQMNELLRQLTNGANHSSNLGTFTQSYIENNNEDIPLEERIKTLITDRNKLGPRDINSSRAAAMEARRRMENTSTRPIRSATQNNNQNSKIHFNDRLAALIDRLYHDQHNQLPDEEFRRRTILTLRELARDVYIQMKNDGVITKTTWKDIDDDVKTYYSMILEQKAKECGWNIYRCVKQWAARGLLSDRCRGKKRSTKNDPKINTQLGDDFDIGDLDDIYGENDSEHSSDDNPVRFFPSASSQGSMFIE
ncbi:hypothetical protein AB4K20DRAFT_1872115 [Rhizopus microsporus]